MDSNQAARVTEVTLERYRKAALSPEGADQWDDPVVEYKNHNEVSKAQLTVVVAATEYFFPRFKGKLSWTHSVLNGWAIDDPTKHTVPMPRGPAALWSIHLASCGYPALGFGLQLQQHEDACPLEMLGICPGDVILPEQNGSLCQLLREGPSSDIIHILHILCKHTPIDSPLVPCIVEQYQRLLKQVEQHLGDSVGFTPQRFRAGLASDCKAIGRSFEDTLEEGRWLADSSLRVYIDMISASEIGVTVNTARLAEAQSLPSLTGCLTPQSLCFSNIQCLLRVGSKDHMAISIPLNQPHWLLVRLHLYDPSLPLRLHLWLVEMIVVGSLLGWWQVQVVGPIGKIQVVASSPAVQPRTIPRVPDFPSPDAAVAEPVAPVA